VKGNDVVCVIKISATLAGSLFTLHASQIRIELPTLSDKDKEVSPGPNFFNLTVDVM
jgi:pyruvate kinase